MIGFAVFFSAAYVMFFGQLASIMGVRTAYGLFIPLLLVAAFGGLFVIWKTARVEKADADRVSV